MPITNLMQKVLKFEIQSYKKPTSVQDLRKSHVPFSGSPRKHPYDPDKVILVIDPYSTSSLFYEFNTADISYVEELPNLVNMDEEAVVMTRIWVKKKSIAIQGAPFVVADTTINN